VARTTEFLKQNPKLPATVVKNLKIMRQEEDRCVRIRQQSLSSE
jgi:hypothetical protein